MTASNDGPASPRQDAASSNDGTTNPQRTGKLHGRAFYEKIGSPKFILAPMVDQSEFVGSPLPFLN